MVFHVRHVCGYEVKRHSVVWSPGRPPLGCLVALWPQSKATLWTKHQLQETLNISSPTKVQPVGLRTKVRCALVASTMTWAQAHSLTMP